MKTQNLTKLALLVAIIMVLGLTPLGFITIGTVGITLVHVPVIVGSYILDIKESAILGFGFGLASFIRCFTTPDAISAIVLGTNTGFGIYNLFLLLMIIFVPRILVGIFTNITYKTLNKFEKTKALSMPISAVVGSLTNTIGVLGGLYLFAFEQSTIGFGLAQGASSFTFLMLLLGVVTFNGSIEAGIAMLISAPIGVAVKKFMKKA